MKKYYLIYGFANEPQEITKSHIYGVYFTAFDTKGKNFGTQSGLHDAIKCTNISDANIILEIAKNYMPNYTFMIVEMDKIVFGADYHKNVYCEKEFKIKWIDKQKIIENHLKKDWQNVICMIY